MANLLGDVSDSQTVAGSTQSDASTMVADHVQIPSATEGQGVVMKAGNAQDFRSVCNASNTTIFVYPPVGCAFNGKTANSPVSLPNGYTALFFFVTTTKINAFV